MIVYMACTNRRDEQANKQTYRSIELLLTVYNIFYCFKTECLKIRFKIAGHHCGQSIVKCRIDIEIIKPTLKIFV